MRKVHRNLSFQLVFVIILVFSIVSLIAGYFDIKFQKKEWLKAESEHAKVIADTILKSIEDIMLSGKQKKLDSVLKNLNEGQHLSGVRILKVESVSKNNKSAELTYKNGEPIYVFKQQIVNKKKCYGCHKSNESIIGFLEISISWKSLMDNIMDNAKMHIIMTLAILLVISLVLVFFMKKVVNRPIQKLLLAFNKVSQGDLNVNVDIKENNELDVLAENFNKMVDNLKQSKESIEKYHQEQIAHADRLASLGKLYASLAHEIKNPLAGIKAAFQTLEQSAKIPIQKEIYEKINIQVNRLAKTVENLLNYSKPITLEIKSVNIQEIIEKAFFFVHKHITDHQIKVEKQYSKEIPDLNLDAELILQVFVNIFLNAISAMPKGGVLAINTSLLDDFVIISICDTGKGIPSKYVDKIFQPFFTTKPGGTGLGLFTSQNIVKMHNGIIEFTSEEVKKTCFVIKLPVNKN